MLLELIFFPVNCQTRGSSMSNLGDNITSGIEVFITDGMKFVSDVVKSLF